MKKTVISISLILGLYFFGSSTYMLAKAHLSQFLIQQAWQKTLNDKKNHKPWSWADSYPVVKLSIPKLDKNSYVLQGESGRNMAFSAVHLVASGMPGESKSTIISAHKDSHFSYLKNVTTGDKISIQDKYRTQHYVITAIEIIDSSQEKLSIRNTDELILTTCYPFSDYQLAGSMRFVVYAQPDKYTHSTPQPKAKNKNYLSNLKIF